MRYGDAAERRDHLDRIVERLALEDEQARYAALSASIDEMFSQGRNVPEELRSEHTALAIKLKLKKVLKPK